MTIHLMLAAGTSLDDAQFRVSRFFAKNFLVKYDQVTFVAARTIGAGEAEFWRRLAEGVEANRRVVGELLGELGDGGFEKLTDLMDMPRGYQSKLLHIITHMLDGFFGVDSVFFNMEEDSHGLSPRLAAFIRSDPGGFWLVEVECTSGPGNDPDRLDLIRRFEVESPA